VAWLALTTEYLKLTGDPRAADDLELGTLNAGLGAQHPSGRWWTYSTPMDGIREASAHSIVFQARAGTPELNCCSVNGPRVLALLADWAVTATADTLALNWLGPGTTTGRRGDGSPVELRVAGDPWIAGQGTLHVGSTNAAPLKVRLRIPGWAASPMVAVNGEAVRNVRPGTYVDVERRWAKTDEIAFRWSLPIRVVPGASGATGRVSLYRGPFLLAWDQAWNETDEDRLPAVQLASLGRAELVPPPGPVPALERKLVPRLVVDVPAAVGRLRLVDFASAGNRGTRYRTWLAADEPPPAPLQTQFPRDGAAVPPGAVPLQWQRSRGTVAADLEFATNAAFQPVMLRVPTTDTNRAEVALAPPVWSPGSRVYWRVASVRGPARTIPDAPAAWFRLDPAAPKSVLPEPRALGPNGEIARHALRGHAPEYGSAPRRDGATPTPEGIATDGRGQKLVFETGPWPTEDYSVVVHVRIDRLPTGHPGQVFSAWSAGSDDPLRLIVADGKLHARIEAGGTGADTPGYAVEAGRWYRLAAVKRGTELRLFVDGREVGRGSAPAEIASRATDCALGGNPHYGGDEHLAATFADFALYGRALEAEEVGR
jgi:hypothetical protein